MDFILFLYLNNKNFSGLTFGCEQEGAIKKNRCNKRNHQMTIFLFFFFGEERKKKNSGDS